MTLDNDKLQELETLRARVHELEMELARDTEATHWPPRVFYTEYYAATGFLLGIFGAITSLVVNAIGAPIVGKSPLELIRVYLTFPLGERALQLASTGKDIYVIGDGVMLAIGSCLYLFTGMLIGVPFFIALVRLTDGKSVAYRLVIASILSLALWAFNFWGILSWLQPLLFKGNWITNPAVLPTWVGAATHLVFGWTLALLYSWGAFQVYTQPTRDPK